MLALLLVAFSVAIGNLGVAASIGVAGVDGRLRLRIAVVFGLFEAAMPLLGLLLGRSLAGSLGGHAKLVAGAVLVVIGAHTIVRELRQRSTSGPPQPPGLARLVVLGLTLSLDNLAVGFALSSYHVNVVVAALVIGGLSVALTLAGLELGDRVGGRLRQRSELVSGIALVGIGVVVASGLIS